MSSFSHVSRSHLNKSHLSEVHSSESYPSESHLSRSHLSRFHLSKSHLIKSHLSKSHLSKFHLSEFLPDGMHHLTAQITILTQSSCCCSCWAISNAGKSVIMLLAFTVEIAYTSIHIPQNGLACKWREMKDWDRVCVWEKEVGKEWDGEKEEKIEANNIIKKTQPTPRQSEHCKWKLLATSLLYLLVYLCVCVVKKISSARNQTHSLTRPFTAIYCTIDFSRAIDFIRCGSKKIVFGDFDDWITWCVVWFDNNSNNRKNLNQIYRFDLVNILLVILFEWCLFVSVCVCVWVCVCARDRSK